MCCLIDRHFDWVFVIQYRNVVPYCHLVVWVPLGNCFVFYVIFLSAGLHLCLNKNTCIFTTNNLCIIIRCFSDNVWKDCLFQKKCLGGLPFSEQMFGRSAFFSKNVWEDCLFQTKCLGGLPCSELCWQMPEYYSNIRLADANIFRSLQTPLNKHALNTS